VTDVEGIGVYWSVHVKLVEGTVGRRPLQMEIELRSDAAFRRVFELLSLLVERVPYLLAAGT
jgi:hypothetical protein